MSFEKEHNDYLHSLGIDSENSTKDSGCHAYCKEYEEYLHAMGVDNGKKVEAPQKIDLQTKEAPWKLIGIEERGIINTVLQQKNAGEKLESSVTYLFGTKADVKEVVINENTRIRIRMANVQDCLVYPEVDEILKSQGGGINWLTIKDELERGVVKQHDVVFPVLWVLTVNGVPFFEKLCGFSIYNKEEELQAIIKKIKNSNNVGEKDVDYAIKWFLSAYNGYAISINGDCESKHRINCIQLYKPDFVDEPQEIDHIIVCSAGVVVIETKDWKGNVHIRPDGKWTRRKDSESSVSGVDSPKFQMRRHEVLMQEILPGVQVHSLLCFSNASTIVDGRENFKDYPIITVDQLEDVLTNLCTKGTYTTEEIDCIVATIEAHKLYKA